MKKRNKFKPSVVHPINRHRYNKRVRAAGEAWTNMSISLIKFGEQLAQSMQPLRKALENIDTSIEKPKKKPYAPYTYANCEVEGCDYIAKWGKPGHSALFEGLKLCNTHYQDAITKEKLEHPSSSKLEPGFDKDGKLSEISIVNDRKNK